jgi:hypothetical protein
MVHDSPDRLVVAFDDERVVANAGIMLPVTLGQRLGIEALVDEIVDLGERPGAARPGRKVLSLAHAMLLGADSIDDCAVPRAGRTETVLGHHPVAPSTLGTFLRSFTFGHVRQLDQVLTTLLGRAWSAGAGPGEKRLVIDIDSFVGEVHGHAKQGAGYGYTGKRYCRGAARPSAQGAGQHSARRAALRLRAHPQGPSRRCQWRDPAARRLGILEQEGLAVRLVEQGESQVRVAELFGVARQAVGR